MTAFKSSSWRLPEILTELREFDTVIVCLSLMHARHRILDVLFAKRTN